MIRICQGVDIVNVNRFAEVFSRHASFVEDVFTKREKGECLSRRNPQIHFAARFAAKEACLKALGKGFTVIGIDNLLREVEVVTHRSGKPLLRLHGWAGKICRRKRIDQLTVSISHTMDYAVAMVILIGV
jgi:holo-[acyl-carrier protein] synthase